MPPTRFKLRVCTWNVGNAQPPADLRPWLGLDSDHYDIIAIGAQEANYSEKLHTPSHSDSRTLDSFFIHPHSPHHSKHPSPSSKSSRLRKISHAIRVVAKTTLNPHPPATQPHHPHNDENPPLDPSFRLRQIQPTQIYDHSHSPPHPQLRKTRSDLSNKSSIVSSKPAFDNLDESLLARRRRSFDRCVSPHSSGDIPVLEHADLFHHEASVHSDLPAPITRPPNLSARLAYSFNIDDLDRDPPPVLTRKCALMHTKDISEISPASIFSPSAHEEAQLPFAHKPSNDGLHSRITRKVRGHISPRAWDDAKSFGQTEDGLMSSGKFNRVIEKNMPPQYHLIAKHHLMEIKLLIYVHERLKERVVRTERVAEATGIGNVVGNKGGVAVKLTLDDTSFCFVCCHLAAHEGAKFLQQRNADVFEIMRSIDRNKSHGPSVMHQYDHMFWMGDLNYRLDLKRILPAAVRWSHEEKWEYVTELIRRERFEDLVLFDELIHEMENEHVFAGFTEGRIRFGPTFKVCRGKAELDYQSMRVPSYCDRILWHSLSQHRKHLRLKEYDCVSSFGSSDHKPVFAVFDAVIPAPIRLYRLPAPRHTVKCTLDFVHLCIKGLYEKKVEEKELRYEVLEDGALAVSEECGEGSGEKQSNHHTRRMVRVEFHGNGLFIKEKQRCEIRLNEGKHSCGYSELPKIALRPMESVGELMYKYVSIVFTRFGSKQGSSCLLALGDLVGHEKVGRDLELTKFGECVGKAKVKVELIVSGETWIDGRNKMLRIR